MEAITIEPSTTSNTKRNKPNIHSNLLDEIKSKEEIAKSIFIETFKDAKTEREFNMFDIRNYNTASFLINLVINLFFILNFLYIYKRTRNIYNSIIAIPFWFVDLILFIAYFKIDPNTKRHFYLKFTKFFLNLVFYYWYFILYMLYNEEDKKSNMIFSFLIHGFLLFFEYVFVIKQISKVACLFIFFGYFVMYLIAMFTTYNVFLIFSKESSLMLKLECNKMIDYWSKIDKRNLTTTLNDLYDYCEEAYENNTNSNGKGSGSGKGNRNRTFSEEDRSTCRGFGFGRSLRNYYYNDYYSNNGNNNGGIDNISTFDNDRISNVDLGEIYSPIYYKNIDDDYFNDINLNINSRNDLRRRLETRSSKYNHDYDNTNNTNDTNNINYYIPSNRLLKRKNDFNKLFFLNYLVNHNESYHELDCFVYYNSNLVYELLFTQSSIFLLIGEKLNYFKYIPEILFSLSGGFLFYMSSFINNYRRQVFIKMKENDVIMNYYHQMINNMQCQLISFVDNRVLFYNDSFEKNFIKKNNKNTSINRKFSMNTNTNESFADKNNTQKRSVKSLNVNTNTKLQFNNLYDYYDIEAKQNKENIEDYEAKELKDNIKDINDILDKKDGFKMITNNNDNFNNNEDNKHNDMILLTQESNFDDKSNKNINKNNKDKDINIISEGELNRNKLNNSNNYRINQDECNLNIKNINIKERERIDTLNYIDKKNLNKKREESMKSLNINSDINNTLNTNNINRLMNRIDINNLSFDSIINYLKDFKLESSTLNDNINNDLNNKPSTLNFNNNFNLSSRKKDNLYDIILKILSTSNNNNINSSNIKNKSSLSINDFEMKYLMPLISNDNGNIINNNNLNIKDIDNDCDSNICDKYSCFQFIGVFSFENKHYKVFLRKFYYKGNNFIIDLMIDDITEIKSAERISLETKIKQKLFSKMAHEFKTPLIVIKSLISDLNDSEIEEEEKSKLSAYIYYLSDYITFLINDIIYYSNNKDIKIQLEEINILEIMEFCEGIAQALIAVMPGNKQNLKIKSNIDSSIIRKYTIVSDPIKLKQILLNLISNSVKFTKCGEITLNALIVNTNSSNPILKIIVKDTGIGIKEDDLVQIREIPGAQDKIISINTEYEYNQMGTGLGLGITKTILKAFGYEFYIDSEYGKGTTFEINIRSLTLNADYNDSTSNCNLICNSIDSNLSKYYESLYSENLSIKNKKLNSFNEKRTNRGFLNKHSSFKSMSYNYNLDNTGNDKENKSTYNLNYMLNSNNKDSSVKSRDVKHIRYKSSLVESSEFNLSKYNKKIDSDNKRLLSSMSVNGCNDSNNNSDIDSNSNLDNSNNSNNDVSEVTKYITNYDLVQFNNFLNIRKKKSSNKIANKETLLQNPDYLKLIKKSKSSLDLSNKNINSTANKSNNNICFMSKHNKNLSQNELGSNNKQNKWVEFINSNESSNKDNNAKESTSNDCCRLFNNNEKNKVIIHHTNTIIHSGNIIINSQSNKISKSILKNKKSSNINSFNSNCINNLNNSNNPYIPNIKFYPNLANNSSNSNINNNNNRSEYNNEKINDSSNSNSNTNILTSNALKSNNSISNSIETVHLFKTNDKLLSQKEIKSNTMNKILIVDDTETIRKSLKRQLIKIPIVSENFEILEAKDGVEILNLIVSDQTEGSRIKMIITDENMEYMCGSTAISILRQLEKENKVHKIFIASLTAFTDEETKNSILKKGADSVLSKPISIKSLNQLLEESNIFNN